MEQVQLVVWLIEAATFALTVAIVYVLWRVVRRSRKQRAEERGE